MQCQLIDNRYVNAVCVPVPVPNNVRTHTYHFFKTIISCGRSNGSFRTSSIGTHDRLNYNSTDNFRTTLPSRDASNHCSFSRNTDDHVIYIQVYERDQFTGLLNTNMSTKMKHQEGQKNAA